MCLVYITKIIWNHIILDAFGNTITVTLGACSHAFFYRLRPRQNGRHFADDIFKCIFFYENAWISLKISLKFVPKVRINNIPALVQIMAWHRPGDKPLSEQMMVSLLTHIFVTRPQWVNSWSQEKVPWPGDLNPFIHSINLYIEYNSI